MGNDNTIYEERGVPTVINGVGTRSQVSGSLVRPEAVEAMKEASKQHAYVADLQAHASEQIADATGADAGLVTAGAASGLALAAAACIAGDDYGIMQQLPRTEGIADEIVLPRAHRCKYDISLRATGATLVGVGTVSHHPVEGGTDDVEPWEIEAAITEDTVAIAYLSRPYNQLAVETVAEVADEAGVPVIVDAADDVRPPERMGEFFDRGATLVSFSGGKTIGGPQSTGILAGEEDLVRSAALQSIPDGYHEDVWSPPQEYVSPEQLAGVPPNGIGRTMKVAKEEIVGLLVALDAYLEEDTEAAMGRMDDRASRIASRLSDSDGLDAEVAREHDHRPPTVVVSLDSNQCPVDAATLVARLRNETPRVWIGENRLHRNETEISPKCLTDEEAEYVVNRILSSVDGSSGDGRTS